MEKTKRIIFVITLVYNSLFLQLCASSCQAFERSVAKGDVVMIQTFLLFKCKLLCYYAY